MKINWKARIKNKVFWLSIIPAVLLLIQKIAIIFGVSIDLSVLGNQLCDVVGTVFAILVILGVAVDPTTEGISDSDTAMLYEEPKKRG